MLEKAFQEPNFRVCCLGRFKLVEVGSGTDMTPASRKSRALVGYLCIVERPIGRERLASLLWGDRGDEQARASLRQAIYELRSMLGGNRLLKLERETVAIGDDVGTDVAAIMTAAQSGSLEQLEQALSEWRGDFFEDLPSIDEAFDAWLQSERIRVQGNLVNAALEAAKTGMARGEIDPARKIVNVLQQHDSTNEIVLRLGLQLDHLAGDTAAVHRRYERFCELLKSELDTTPATESLRLFQELTARSSEEPEIVAHGPRSDVADKERELRHQEGAKDAAPSGPPSIARGSARSVLAPSDLPLAPGRLDRKWLVVIVVVVACLGALAWAIVSRSYNTVPAVGTPVSSVTNASPAVAAERLLLGIDANSEQTVDLAGTEKAARAAAQRILVRDPNNGEALGVLAVLTPYTRLREIDRLLARALRSDPTNVQLLNWHGRFLTMVGRSHEALGDLTRAYDRDRTTPSIAANLVLALLLSQRPEEAREIVDLFRYRGQQEESSLLHVKYFLYTRNWFGLANYLRVPPDHLSPARAAFFRLCRETAIAFVTRERDKFPSLRASWRNETAIEPDDTVQALSALGDAGGALDVIQTVASSRRNADLLIDPGWQTIFGPGLISLRRDSRMAALFAQWGLSDYWRAVNHLPDFMR